MPSFSEEIISDLDRIAKSSYPQHQRVILAYLLGCHETTIFRQFELITSVNHDIFQKNCQSVMQRNIPPGKNRLQ